MIHVRTAHEWIEELRNRSSVYLGPLGHRSLVALLSFMEGLRSTPCPDPDPPYGGFHLWLACGDIARHKLVEELGDQGAFERFFELYDEYRRCQRVHLLRVILRDNKANFMTSDEGPPQRPLEMIISQLAPSEAYALKEIYVDHVRGEWSLFPSIDDAKASARGYWNVQFDDWQSLPDECKPRKKCQGGVAQSPNAYPFDVSSIHSHASNSVSTA